MGRTQGPAGPRTGASLLASLQGCGGPGLASACCWVRLVLRLKQACCSWGLGLWLQGPRGTPVHWCMGPGPHGPGPSGGQGSVQGWLCIRCVCWWVGPGGQWHLSPGVHRLVGEGGAGSRGQWAGGGSEWHSQHLGPNHCHSVCAPGWALVAPRPPFQDQRVGRSQAPCQWQLQTPGLGAQRGADSVPAGDSDCTPVCGLPTEGQRTRRCCNCPSHTRWPFFLPVVGGDVFWKVPGFFTDGSSAHSFVFGMPMTGERGVLLQHHGWSPWGCSLLLNVSVPRSLGGWVQLLSTVQMPACACYFTQKVNMRNFRSEKRIKRNILNVLRNISFI